MFVRDPFSYDFEILSEISNVDLVTLGYVGFVKLLVVEFSSDMKQIFYRMPSLDLELGLKPLKNDADLVECGTKNDYVLHIYVSHSVFDLHDATATTSQQNVDTESDLKDDYIFLTIIVLKRVTLHQLIIFLRVKKKFLMLELVNQTLHLEKKLQKCLMRTS
nr:transposase, Ptta/En/Spm [Tanacetum cinerariifolium]